MCVCVCVCVCVSLSLTNPTPTNTHTHTHRYGDGDLGTASLIKWAGAGPRGTSNIVSGRRVLHECLQAGLYVCVCVFVCASLALFLYFSHT